MKIGGIAGRTDNATLEEVFVRPNVTVNATTLGSGMIPTNSTIIVKNSYVSAKVLASGLCGGISTYPLTVTLNNSYSDVNMSCSNFNQVLLSFSLTNPVFSNFYYLNDSAGSNFTGDGVISFVNLTDLRNQVSSTFDQCNIWSSYRLKIEKDNNLADNCSTPIPSTLIPSTTIPSSNTPSSFTTQQPSTSTQSTSPPFTLIPPTIPPSTLIPSTIPPSTFVPPTQITCIYSVLNCEKCDNSISVLNGPNIFNVSCQFMFNQWIYLSNNSSSNTTVLAQPISLNKTNTGTTSFFLEGDFNQTSNSTITIVLNDNQDASTPVLVVSGCVSLEGNVDLVLDDRPSRDQNISFSLISYNCSQQAQIDESRVTLSAVYPKSICDSVKKQLNNQPNSLSVSISINLNKNCGGENFLFLFIFNSSILYFFPKKNKVFLLVLLLELLLAFLEELCLCLCLLHTY